MTSTTKFRSPATPSTPKSGVPYNTENAALRGASIAFARPPLKPKPSLPDSTGNNGALIAATKAGSTQTSPTHYAVSRQSTGNSSLQSTTSPSPSRRGVRTPDTFSTLQIPSDSSSSRSRSPSNIAATLAAARYTPIVAKPPTQLKPPQVRHSMEESREITRAAPSLNAVQKMGGQKVLPDVGTLVNRPPEVKPTPSQPDETPIPSTSALIRLFEQSKTTVSEPERPQTPDRQSAMDASISRPPILSPTPRRTFSIKKAIEEKGKVDGTESGQNEGTENASPAPRSVAQPIQPQTIRRVQKDAPVPSAKKPETSQNVAKAPSRTSSRRELSTDTMGELSPVSSYESAPETVEPIREILKEKPRPPPPRRTAVSTSSDKKALSSSPPKLVALKSRPTSTLHTFEPYSRPTSTPNSAYGRQSLRQITAHLTGDSLANAMVGAALASSKNPSREISPVRSAGPPLPRRHEKPGHAHNFFHRSRTPSPVKQPGKLRQTLRKESTSPSSEDGNHHKRKKMFRRKHPNKHHEGARKRWRDAITERERKRYEGVWAANKGIHIQVSAIPPHQRFGNEQLEVLDLVVREIWTRSRLPAHVLEEVWELVDNRKVNRLTREEFVVGLWLVDQRLKGRKLPPRVGESVWSSVTGAGTHLKYRK